MSSFLLAMTSIALFITPVLIGGLVWYVLQSFFGHDTYELVTGFYSLFVVISFFVLLFMLHPFIRRLLISHPLS
ncbi:hypothetical protein [Alkalihalobacterium bogoriense]|uniref:hypothetical protein n=1 Tax=Alkalihalobacterium bogoriense TaxID=246272 RepID=UPI000AF155CE|nr:hypothetical protein [Alkalihalobacterium bogoriense]